MHIVNIRFCLTNLILFNQMIDFKNGAMHAIAMYPSH